MTTFRYLRSLMRRQHFSIASDCPAGTVTSPMMRYGLPASVHVPVCVPETFVAKAACIAPLRTVIAKTRKMSRILFPPQTVESNPRFAPVPPRLVSRIVLNLSRLAVIIMPPGG